MTPPPGWPDISRIQSSIVRSSPHSTRPTYIGPQIYPLAYRPAHGQTANSSPPGRPNHTLARSKKELLKSPSCPLEAKCLSVSSLASLIGTASLRRAERFEAFKIRSFLLRYQQQISSIHGSLDPGGNRVVLVSQGYRLTGQIEAVIEHGCARGLLPNVNNVDLPVSIGSAENSASLGLYGSTVGRDEPHTRPAWSELGPIGEAIQPALNTPPDTPDMDSTDRLLPSQAFLITVCRNPLSPAPFVCPSTFIVCVFGHNSPIC
ncbi:unnamed protein product [Protopolystoma xenopodis]|uniref:Uncharacterized protein n=1 Tax=Protopolystoma xenopodis TaxID=117903 RepID=A0A3S5B8J0_9PLAT|nr:unnamed protein product [Protopolystoma xenopodis]